MKSLTSKKGALTGIAFILPFFSIYVLFVLYPLIQGFLLSLHKWNLTGAKLFVGTANYGMILKDALFWTSLKHTLMFVCMSTPCVMVTAFLLALFVNNSLIKKPAIYRIAFFAPMILSVSIVSFLWLFVLQPQTGLVSTFLKTVGVEQEILWFSNPKLVWGSMIVITLWWTSGYDMIIYLAAMQNIPDSIYESASLDGAKPWQITRYITIPYLKETHFMVLFLEVIASFKIFGQVFLITQGGPAGKTRTFIQYIYEKGFQNYEMGLASAASMLFFLLILLVSAIQLIVKRKNNGREAA